MDVGNIFKSLFGIYKTTELLMQHHMCTRTHTTTLISFNSIRCRKWRRGCARSRRRCASYRAEVQEVAQLLVGAQSRHALLLHPARAPRGPRAPRTYKHGHTRTVMGMMRAQMEARAPLRSWFGAGS